MFRPEGGKYIEKTNFFLHCRTRVSFEQKFSYPTFKIIKQNKIKIISPSIFGITIICFLVSFVKLSCSGEKLATTSGLQFITGSSIEKPNKIDQEPNYDRITLQPLIIFSLLFSILGFIISFSKKRLFILFSFLISLLAIIFLLIFKFSLDSKILKEGKGFIQIEYGIGYILIIVFYILLVIFNSILFLQKKYIVNLHNIFKCYN